MLVWHENITLWQTQINWQLTPMWGRGIKKNKTRRCSGPALPKYCLYIDVSIRGDLVYFSPTNTPAKNECVFLTVFLTLIGFVCFYGLYIKEWMLVSLQITLCKRSNENRSKCKYRICTWRRDNNITISFVKRPRIICVCVLMSCRQNSCWVNLKFS